jgi:hypothetical protein
MRSTLQPTAPDVNVRRISTGMPQFVRQAAERLRRPPLQAIAINAGGIVTMSRGAGCIRTIDGTPPPQGRPLVECLANDPLVVDAARQALAGQQRRLYREHSGSLYQIAWEPNPATDGSAGALGTVSDVTEDIAQ